MASSLFKGMAASKGPTVARHGTIAALVSFRGQGQAKAGHGIGQKNKPHGHQSQGTCIARHEQQINNKDAGLALSASLWKARGESSGQVPAGFPQSVAAQTTGQF
jgi:hypothetical protein